MPTWPAGVTLVTIRHTPVTTGGRIFPGSSVTARASERLWTDDGSILPADAATTVQADGSWELTLPAVDAGVRPSGAAYRLTEHVPGAQDRSVWVAPMSHHAPGPVDLADVLTPQPAPGGGITIQTGPATDPSMAEIAQDPDSEFRSALHGAVEPMVGPLVSDAIAADDTVAQAAAAAAAPAAQAAVAVEAANGGLAAGVALAGTQPTHLWMPPAQPALPDLASWTGQQFIDAYETLRAAAPEYVTRQQVGSDAEANPIWAYFFTPAAYDNTVLVFNQHGYEKVAIHSVYTLARLLTTEWVSSPRLAALRARTRLVVVPFVTWHGVDNTTRTNANGVDLNRNWDWKWEGDPGDTPGTETYKGTAPFSEPETQALRDLVGVLDAQGDLVAALDAHSVGYSQQEDPYYVYFGLPDRELGGATWAVELAREIAPDPLPRYIHGSSTPKASSWVQAQGVRSLTVEYYQSFGEVGLDATNMTYALRTYGNTIMRAAETPSLRSARASSGAIVRTFDYASGSGPNVFIAGAGSSSNTEEIVELRHDFKPPCAGVVVWAGQVLFGQGTAGRLWMQPVAGSDSTRSWWLTQKKSFDVVYADLDAVADRVIVPFMISRPVTDSSSDIWPFRLALHASSNATSPPQVIRYQSTMVFIPTQGPDRFERWTATGRAGDGAMQMATGI